MSIELRSIIEKAKLLLLELNHVTQKGPHFRIVHRFGRTGMGCYAGEEVVAVYLIDGSNEIMLPLSLALRLLLDYLAHHRHIPQSATQIAAGMRVDLFYRKHGLNSGNSLRRNISRTAVKEYIKRIRAALNIALRKTALAIDPHRVLASCETMSNEVHYHLRASVEWVHIDDLPLGR
jgi:hypothetical protein